MVKPKSELGSLKSESGSSSILSPLNNVPINTDHAIDDGIGPAGPLSQNRDELCPCIFHLYFKVCENVDCDFSHSSKAIASRPPSRLTSPLSRYTKEKGIFQPRGGSSQPCRYFVTGNCKRGDRCKYLHERPKIKSVLPSRSMLGHSDDSVATMPSPRRLEQSTSESSTTFASPVVQKVELSMAQNEGFFGDLEDDQNNNHFHTEVNNSQPKSPHLECTSPSHPSYQNTPTPEAPSSHYDPSGRDASKASLHDDPSSSYADDWDGVDTGDDHNSEPSFDDPDTSKGGTASRPSNNDEDKWGWNEDPREKKEGKVITVNQDGWGFKVTRRDKVDIKVEEPVHVLPDENPAAEEGSKIDPAWSQVPDGKVEKDERGFSDDRFTGDDWEDNSEEELHPVVEASSTQDFNQQDSDRGQQVYDQSPAAEGVEESGAGGERQDLENPTDEAVEELDASNRPYDVYWQHSAPEFAEELDAGDESPVVRPLSSQLVEESASGPPDNQHMVFEPQGELSPVDRSGDSQPRTPASHSLRLPVQACSSTGPMRPPGTVFSDTDTTARSIPAATSLSTSLTSIPPVPVSVPPSIPTLIPASDARQTSMMSLHWCRFADGTTDPAIAFCKAFAQNKCSNTTSDTCTFRHCLTPQEYTLLFKDPQPLQFSLQKSLIRNDSPENTTLITSPSFTLHWSHFADPTCDPQVAFCKPYAEHKCPYDIACNYRHCLTLEEYTLLFKDPQPNLISIGGTTRGQSTIASQQGLSSRRRALCSFFKKGKGGCKNGINCPFLHECPSIHLTGLCIDASCSFCSSTPETIDQVRPHADQKLCTFWPKGTCKNGDKCPFTHIGDPGVVSTSGGDEAIFGGALDDTVRDNQWCAWEANGDSNGWDSRNAGNWGDGDVNSEQEVKNDLNDQNHLTEWDNQNITIQGQDKQFNDGSGSGDQKKNDDSPGNRRKGWENQNNYVSGWEDRNDDASGWENQNHDISSWENKNDNNNGLGRQSNNYDRQRRSNDRRDGAHYGNKRSRYDWYNSGTKEMKKDNICYAFSREGRCWKDQDCRFSHDLEQGGSGGHGSRNVSKIRPSKRTPHALTADPASTYGGRGHYDRGFIDGWKREVAASEIVSEASGSLITEKYKGTGSQSGSCGHANERIRSVEHLLTGDTCRFYLVGRCTIGDTCPSSHDPVVPDINDNEDVDLADGQEVPTNEARHLGREKGSRGETYKNSLSSEVENRARNDGIRFNHATNSNWGHDDQQDDVSVRVPEEEVQINISCGQDSYRTEESHHSVRVGCERPSPERSVKNQRFVTREDEEQEDESEPGTWSHVSDIDPQAEVRERDYGHPLVERSISGCAVIFGRGCLPDEIMTGIDSHVLVFEGPPGISEARVHDYAHTYGPIKDIIITPDVPVTIEGSEHSEQQNEENRLQKSTIRIEFKDMKDAATATKSFRDHNAALADAIPIESANMTSTWVRFRWPQVTRAAWIHYSSVVEAKAMAEKLHGSLFRQKKITASFLRPDKRQKDLYAIKLERLPADTTRGDLIDISPNSRLITISELTYTANPREVLQQSAGVKFFVNIPEDPAKISAVAFACLDSENSILRALQMHGTKPKLIGKQEFTVERVWFVQYTLPTDVFKSVSTEIAALQVQHEGRAQVESCDFGGHYMVYLHAPYEETEIFVQANFSLQAICHGLVVIALDSQPEWDDYLYSTSSIKVIENLNSKNSFYIFPNLSTRQIHVFGCGIDQDKGVATVRKLLQRVRGSCREYSIHRNVLRQLTDNGLTEIQAGVGANKLSLDVLRSVLIVRGEDAVLMEKIRHLLDFLPSQENLSYSRQVCSVCKLQPGGSEPNPIVKLICGHVYCGACLKNALIFATQNHSAPVKCIGRGPAYDLERGNICGQSIAYTTARDLLPVFLEPEYLEVAFLSFIHANLDKYFFCPSLKCNTVYRRGDPDSIIRCSVCRAWLCLFCGSMSHDGIACEKAKEIRANIRG